MILFICTLTTILLLGIICLDICRKINLTHKAIISFFLIIAPHISILIYLFPRCSTSQMDSTLYRIWLITEGIIFIAYLWLKIHIFPYSKKQVEDLRLRVLLGGKRLVLYSLYTFFIQIIFYGLTWNFLMHANVPPQILVADIIVTILFVVTLYINGIYRILLTSRRLNIIKKVTIVFTMFIPLVQILVIIYVCYIASSEYEHECYRVVKQSTRVDSDICKTKYPLVLVHGLGFKDFKYVNYWGRIPKELIKNGATVYYGNQEAWGTIEYNAQDIKNRILDIINETGCEKVNIIAHSKGGLDSRYMIGKLQMEDYVASLTMIGSPHRGSEMIEIIYRIPHRIFKMIGRCMNRYFKLIGDKNPDFFYACWQMSISYSQEFNQDVADSNKVYYQSYSTAMRNMFSDYILTLPYLFIKRLGGENDGLVTVESAKWGSFKGVIKNNYTRGISHGDIIDLRKNDYKGFDVREFYTQMVADLKNTGF